MRFFHIHFPTEKKRTQNAEKEKVKRQGNRRGFTNDYEVVNGASMDNGVGADGDIISNFRGQVSLDLSNMDNCSIANARLRSNLDIVDITSNSGSVPYTERRTKIELEKK